MPSLRFPRLAAAGFATALFSLGWSGLAAAAPNGCEAAKAIDLIGKDAPPDPDVKALTGATLVRRVAPGDVATMDYRPERLSLGVENGRVVSARCG